MKKTLFLMLAALISFAFAAPSFAGWVADPVEITVPTPFVSETVATTGAVTTIDAPASGHSYFLRDIACSQIKPVADFTHTVATTGRVTVVAAPPSGQYYLLNLVACPGMLPALPTNTVTVTAGTNSYVFTNGTTTARASALVTNGASITVTLSGGVTNLPPLTFYRTWYPDTNTLSLVFVQDATTNTFVFSNSVSTAAVSLWITNGTSMTATLSASVTNLPALTFTRVHSPATNTFTLTGGDQWRIYGARMATGIRPALDANALSVSAVYANGYSESYCSMTNGSAPYSPAAALLLLPLDSFRVIVTGATNSPSVRFPAERWND